MLSASLGSLSSRYRSALASALGTASCESDFRSNMISSAQYSKHLRNRVVQVVDDTLLERDDGIVGNGDAFRTYLRAALRDVAITDAVRIFQIARAPLHVERIHLERRRVHEMPRTDELREHAMVTQYVTHILTEKTLDALAELLHALSVDLSHSPGAVGL